MPRPRALTPELAEWCGAMLAMGYGYKVIIRDIEAATGQVLDRKTIWRAVLEHHAHCGAAPAEGKDAA